jgi:hypothetical protein
MGWGNSQRRRGAAPRHYELPPHGHRQRYKTPIYNLTTGQPLPDVKGGNLAVHFDNSAFHSLFPNAELAIVRIPKPPDRASPGEVAEHQARIRELVEQGI